MRNQSQKRLGIIALLLTAILWSLSGVFIKYIPWNPVAIAGVRSFFALFLLVPLTRRENWHFSKDQWLVAISYVGMMVGFVVATKWTTAANAILLQYTSPVYIILLSTVFLGEKITWRDWLTMAVTGIGMGAFFLDKLGGGSVAGNLIAIFSGVCVAFVTIFLRRLKSGRIEAIVLGNILVFLVSIPFLEAPWPDTYGWISLVFLGIVQLGLSFFLYTWATPRVSTIEQALVPMIEPLLNPFWVFLAFGEAPGVISIFGGALVLFSVTARCVWESYEQNKKFNQ